MSTEEPKSYRQLFSEWILALKGFAQTQWALWKWEAMEGISSLLSGLIFVQVLVFISSIAILFLELSLVFYGYEKGIPLWICTLSLGGLNLLLLPIWYLLYKKGKLAVWVRKVLETTIQHEQNDSKKQT